MEKTMNAACFFLIFWFRLFFLSTDEEIYAGNVAIRTKYSKRIFAKSKSHKL